MRKVYGILFALMLLCIGCQWQLRPGNGTDRRQCLTIQRYDRIESLYLTTGDYSALQQLNTYYPMQTRLLIENMLQLGQVNDSDINTKFLNFFQDSTLQHMLAEVQRQYTDIDDINEELSEAFSRLQEMLPGMELPEVYAQIGSFDQSILVDHNTLGISLDKYLGADYPFYVSHYTDQQRRLMTRTMIVPDCLSFYILSLYPLPPELSQLPEERNRHMGKIQWGVNKATGRRVFDNAHVQAADSYMQQHPQTSFEDFLHDYGVSLKKND